MSSAFFFHLFLERPTLATFLNVYTPHTSSPIYITFCFFRLCCIFEKKERKKIVKATRTPAKTLRAKIRHSACTSFLYVRYYKVDVMLSTLLQPIELWYQLFHTHSVDKRVFFLVSLFLGSHWKKGLQRFPALRNARTCDIVIIFTDLG